MTAKLGIFQCQADLPTRISEHLDQEGAGEAKFVIAFKTELKPNATIPLLWFVLHKDHVTLCNTHKTRGVYKRYHINEINSVRLVASSRLGSSRIDLISNNLQEEDFCLPLSHQIDLDVVRNALISTGIQIA